MSSRLVFAPERVNASFAYFKNAFAVPLRVAAGLTNRTLFTFGAHTLKKVATGDSLR